MSEYTLRMDKPADLARKLSRERARFNDAVRSGNEDLASDQLFNFAITAWHVVDWIWKTDPSIIVGWSGTKFIDFQTELKTRCRGLALCQDLANGSKHFTITKYAPTAVRAEKQTIRHGGGIGQSIGSPIGQPIGESISGGWTEECYVVELQAGERVKLQQVMTDVIQFWVQTLGTDQASN